MTGHNEFGYYRAADGVYVTTRNGDSFLENCGAFKKGRWDMSILKRIKQLICKHNWVEDTLTIKSPLFSIPYWESTTAIWKCSKCGKIKMR